MLNVESGSRIYLCTGHTDMRKGINGLSLLAQSVISDKLNTRAQLAMLIEAIDWRNPVRHDAPEYFG